MFGRMFSLTAALILLSCVLLGLSFRVVIGRYLLQERKETLEANATSVANLASAYDTAGELENNWDFRISLSFAADVSSGETLICNEAGTVVLCSCGDRLCEYLGKTVDESILSRAETSGSYYECGTLDGLYEESRLCVCMPVVSNTSGECIGSVIVSTDVGQVTAFLARMTNVFLMTSVVVLIIAITATSFASNKETRPLKELAKTAREFGHGNLSARVPTGKENTEETDELAAAFNNMANSLEKSELQRREFVANVSHELKTPMTTIAGFMDGMLDGTIPAEQYPKYMQTVSDEVRRLSRLVRSMLEISRMQDQGIPDGSKQKFDVCETIGRALLTFEQKITTKHLLVEVQMPDNGILVFAQEDSITQVIYNLLDNAVKFCGEGGNLYLQAESDGTKATVSVANTGPTIQAEELPLVFERFHKTDKSRSMDRDGVGLGLYIVKTIVVNHGEDISVTSRDGVTRFSFTLPVK
ncbi:MAG: HAMP domain-containing sensor histidine kinase [Oscillospiraceae bacterium]|nr:HAMP domain-containing sensor histidine kinase [Oscillospiraceae bacterium]